LYVVGDGTPDSIKKTNYDDCNDIGDASDLQNNDSYQTGSDNRSHQAGDETSL